MSGVEGNGDGGPRPPSGFGPFDALPTLTDVQRRGMDAASHVINRFIDLLRVEPPPRPAGQDAEPVNDHEPDFAELRTSVARALDLYTDLVRRSFEGYADLMEQTLRARGVQLNAAEDGQTGLLTLRGGAGVQATGTVWMHNTTDHPASAVLRFTDLTAHDGLVVPACAGSFERAALHIAPRGSVSASLVIGLSDAAPGVYRGHVLASGIPDAALPIRLIVTDVAPGPGLPS
jgi:hypothetical protein